MEFLAFILFLARSSIDPLFQAVPIKVAGMEMTGGAFLNLAILGFVGLMILTRPTSAFPFRAWLPFLLVAAASITWSPDKGGGIRALLVLVTYASLFAVPFLVKAYFRHSAYLLKAVIYSSIVPVAVGALELVFFLDPSSRVKSTFAHPNVFAFYLMVVLGVIYFLLSSSAVQFKPSVRKLMISYSGLLVGLIIMTQTRAAWVGTFLIVATYAACINRRYLFVVLLLPLLIFVPSVSHRLADLERGTAYTGAIGSRADELNSFAWRQLMWKSAFIDVAETPFFGKGLASFAPNSLKFFPAAGTSKSDQRGLGAHSAFVQAFYETGAVGFVCYFVIFITLFFRILRHFKDDPRGAIMLASTILAYMMANFSDNMFDYGTANLYFWGFVGIVFAKWAQQRNWAQQQSVFSFSPSRLAYPYRVPAKTISLS